MKAFPSAAVVLSACAVLSLTGCMLFSSFPETYENEINSAAKAIGAAPNDTERADAYSRRGAAYSEKARYNRAFHKITPEEYERLFALAQKDFDQALALNPASADAYFNRGQAYYDRANLETIVNGSWAVPVPVRKERFRPAIENFSKAVEKVPKLALAWDRLGLTYETLAEYDEAIQAYSKEMPLDEKLGKSRLADTYCERAQANQGAKNDPVADFEKSIDYGKTDDGCSCEPWFPGLQLAIEAKRYDDAWAIVAKTLRHGKAPDPNLLLRLTKESGRSK